LTFNVILLDGYHGNETGAVIGLSSPRDMNLLKYCPLMIFNNSCAWLKKDQHDIYFQYL